MKINFILTILLFVMVIGGSLDQYFFKDIFAQNSNGNDNSTNTKKIEKKQKELDEKKIEHYEKTEQKQHELEKKKIELKHNRENLELKQIEKSKEFQDKLNVKARYQNNTGYPTTSDVEPQLSNDTEQQSNKDTEQISQKSIKFEEYSMKTSKEIREILAINSERLDPRSKHILDKVNNGEYLGTKISSSVFFDTYELVFDSVEASKITENLETSSFVTGKMIFTTYDKSKSNLKLELLECQIVVDNKIFNCVFGKARTIASGQIDSGHSLVVVAFLEDELLEIHTTLKLFLNSDIAINEIKKSQLSIIGNQSKISHMWFLNGTATLSKITLSENISTEYDIANSTQNKIPNGD